MKWIVGLDVRPSSQGAIRFAAWLRASAVDPAQVDLIGTHVLEHDTLMLALRRHHLDDVLRQVEEAAAESVEGVGATDQFSEVRVVRAMKAEDSLAGARQMHAADGIVIGRQAGRDDLAVVRLGRVARRLLRSLPGPVAVVRPDLLPSHLGDGPLVCVVRPSADSVQAVRMATHLATGLGRELELLHVSKPPSGLELLRPGTGSLLAELREQAKAQLDAWVRDNGLGDVATNVVSGGVVTTIRDRAERLASPLIVCGSRRLTPYQRVFGSSIASELASSCPIPVLVVPPDTAASGDPVGS